MQQKELFKKLLEYTDERTFVCIQSGQVGCYKHIGSEGMSAVAQAPTSEPWVTPLNVWIVVTDQMKTFADEDGWPLLCEGCREDGGNT